MLRLLLCYFFVLFSFSGIAQQDPQFGQYMLNPGIWNPSYAAVKKQTSFCFHHRTQWLGYTASDNSLPINPPSTQMLTAATSIGRIRSGIGLNLLNDNIGPLRNQNVFISYSYYYPVGDGKISAGIGVGVQQISINPNQWRPREYNDLTITEAASLNQIRPAFRLGLSYTTDNFFIGLASNNVSNPSYTFGTEKISSKLELHYYLQSSYRFSINDNIRLQPSAIIKSVQNVNSFEISNLVFFQSLWFGASYRTGDALIFLAGIELLQDKSLKIGYNFDLSVINAKAKSVSSHEIFLSYNLGSLLDNKKPIIRSPRFRF